MERYEVRQYVLDQVSERNVRNEYRSSWVLLSCPVCEANGKPSSSTLNVNVVEGWYFCFRAGCNTKGPIPEIKDQIGAIDALFADVEGKSSKKAGLPEGFQPLFDPETGAPTAQGAFLEEGRKYVLKGRGLSEDVARQAMLGVARVGKCWRLIIPNWSWGNALCGFAGRQLSAPEPTVEDLKKHRMNVSLLTMEGLLPSGHRTETADVYVPRYYMPPEFDRSDIYMAEELRRETDEPIFVVEGPIDALALWPNAVCCHGQPDTEQVISIASVATRPVVFALDRDTKGKNAFLYAQAKRIAPDKRWGAINWAQLEPFNDAGEVMAHGIDAQASFLSAVVWGSRSGVEKTEKAG
jgi:hypothetical protein